MATADTELSIVSAGEEVETGGGMKLGATPIDQRNWFYDDPDGIDLIHQVVSASGSVLKTESIKLPWALVRAALARRDKKKQPRRQASR